MRTQKIPQHFTSNHTKKNRTNMDAYPKIPVHEKFYAFQGEGVHMGVSAYFIRTFGCPLACPWCDSAGTWHKDYVPKKVDRQDVYELAKTVDEISPSIVVITGGEPTIHKTLPDLVEAIHGFGVYPVHLETSGAFSTEAKFDWITLSPKWSQVPLKEMLLRADELKIIVEHENSINEWMDRLLEIGGEEWMACRDSQPVWLHPEWSQRNNEKVLNSISEYVKASELDVRAGYQLHKLYQVDSLDAGSRELAPLGGDPERGY